MTAYDRRVKRPGVVAYWAGAIVLVAFGYPALFGIGAPFLLTGLAMLIVGPWRGRATVLWPTLVGVWSFVLGYILVAPLYCTATAGPVAPGAPFVQHTTCTNVLGIDYSEAGNYNPSLLPGFIAGLMAGAMGAVLTRRVIARRRRSAGAS